MHKKNIFLQNLQRLCVFSDSEQDGVHCFVGVSELRGHATEQEEVLQAEASPPVQKRQFRESPKSHRRHNKKGASMGGQDGDPA
jgi:hypothetical protein